MDAPTFTTERLHLRMLQESDFEEYSAIHLDPDVTYFTVRQHLDRLGTWRHMATIVGHWHLRGFGMWGVFERESGRLAGRVGFHQPATWPEFELAWTIGKEFWGRGYAPEAARVCLDYAFNVMGRKRVISLIDPLNVASIRVAEKIGQTFSGETFETYGVAHHMYEARR